MALEFIGDAISLSGLTGSKKKCEVIGEYYPFWWNITSGGKSANNDWPTAIVELDAAIGEVYIKDTEETILGSSGHALHLKCNNPNARKLKVILVEKDADCFSHLKNVIRRRWSNVNVQMAEGPVHSNSSGIYLLNMELDRALNTIDGMELGNALFLFDPLRSVEYQAIERVVSKRITSYYGTRTEFIVFIFTSDWFLGRDDFAALPTHGDETAWSVAEKKTVFEADGLFGNTNWRERILTDKPISDRESELIELYKTRLHKWFRYVLAMPFSPKGQQVFHLILCSNFETGVRAKRSFYCDITGNIAYAPDNTKAFSEFRKCHPEIFEGLSGRRRPLQWRMLWKIITEHEEGICDYQCSDFRNIAGSDEDSQRLLEWLQREGYREPYDAGSAWDSPYGQYRLDWRTVKGKLGIDPPSPLTPPSSEPPFVKEIEQ